MGKKLKYLMLIMGTVLILSMANCGEEEDVGLICAGCPDDAPWSVAGSADCYERFEDCDAGERGDCTICN